jgi:spermidine synthase
LVIQLDNYIIFLLYNYMSVQQEGDDVVHIESGAEYSRVNTKTKECQHWYAKKICSIVEMIVNKNKTKKYNILVFGVALGGIIIQLLDRLDNIRITGIDIEDDNFDFVRKHSDNNRLTLVKNNAEQFIIETPDIFDIIICDIFNVLKVPKFVLDDSFLINCYWKLKKNGYFIINTIGVDYDNIINKFNKIFKPTMLYSEYQYFLYMKHSNMITVLQT